MKNIPTILWVLLFFVSCKSPATHKKLGAPDHKTTKTITVPTFNADSAYHYTAKQVSFGPRVPGTAAHKKCANWLVKKLQGYCDTVIVQHFKARTYDKVLRNGQNIIGSFNPSYQNRILLMAHWDSRPFADHDKDPSKRQTPIDAANDGASGVGVLLEIARQIHLQKPGTGIDILLFDLEDWGPPSYLNLYGEDYWGLGSQYWSKNPHIQGYSATFGILLDMVGAKNATFPKEYFSRQYARYYVDLVWNKAFTLGYDNYFIDRDGYPIDDDHKYVNEIAGIPTLDIIHLDTKSSNGTFFEYWHTTGDTMDKIDKNTLKAVGQVLLTVIYNKTD
jgi:Zn-dependent M28 family amino/carboxypeptidase